MSKFNEYARKLDAIVKTAFDEAKLADAAFDRAERAKNNTPQLYGNHTAEYEAKRARVQADYVEAMQKKNAVREKMGWEYRRQIEQLRKELQTDVTASYQVRPDQIDANTLELLKSGILTVGEYRTLLDSAFSNSNPTMARLIGKYADDAASAIGDNTDPDALALRRMSTEAKHYNGNTVLQAFDSMVDVYNRAINNPYMIGQWDDLCGALIEEF